MGQKLAEKMSDTALGYDVKNAPDSDNVKDEAENENGLMRPYDPKTHLEYIALEKLKIRQENEKLERDLRKENARKAYKFSKIWGIFIAFLILLHGFGKCYDFFEITQTEFLFIIGTLTTGIFTFFTLVLKYLFYRKPNKNSTSEKQ